MKNRKISKLVHETNGYKIHVAKVARSSQDCETIIMVNGAMSTTSSFSWVISELSNHNIILFDSPFIGCSRQYNTGKPYPDRNIEALILYDLCEEFKPDYVCSMSWGGVSTLLALSKNPGSVKKCIAAAFSFGLTQEFYDLILCMTEALNNKDMDKFAELVNSTLGLYLPDRLKAANGRYLSSISDDEIVYLKQHFAQFLAIDISQYDNSLRNINTPVLFINGNKDQFTSQRSVLEACNLIADSETVEVDCGHFMALENKVVAAQLIEIIDGYFYSE
jgi:rhamnosyltransferase subunit A